MSKDAAIKVSRLKKSYTNDSIVLDGISFEIKAGQIFALLGPNGAGKTTTIKIISTLLKPDEGDVKVNGYDVVDEQLEVRASIGLTGQYAAVDEYLTGRENMMLIGQLYHLPKSIVIERTDKLIADFDLVEAQNRPVKTYSGGMKRRLDLAMSLIANPKIICLDEPTTGLDPRSRMTMWSIIKDLAAKGTTILLTTQYMEEADYLADWITVIDGGKIIAEGTADELKAKIGNDRVEIKLSSESDAQKAMDIFKADQTHLDKSNNTISLTATLGVESLRQCLNQLEKAGLKPETASLRRPTLDDVFLTLTGHDTSARDEDSAKSKPKSKKGAK